MKQLFKFLLLIGLLYTLSFRATGQAVVHDPGMLSFWATRIGKEQAEKIAFRLAAAAATTKSITTIYDNVAILTQQFERIDRAKDNIDPKEISPMGVIVFNRHYKAAKAKIEIAADFIMQGANPSYNMSVGERLSAVRFASEYLHDAASDLDLAMNALNAYKAIERINRNSRYSKSMAHKDFNAIRF